MHLRRISINKNDAKKPCVTNASDNHISETHVTEVAPHSSICSLMSGLIFYNSMYILRESAVILELRSSDE